MPALSPSAPSRLAQYCAVHFDGKVGKRDTGGRAALEKNVFSPFMCNLWSAGRRASRLAGWRLFFALMFAWAVAAPPALADCLASTDPAIRELQNLVNEDAARALKQVQAQLLPLE